MTARQKLESPGRKKLLALDELGVDRILRIRFDASLQTMSARDFITRIFVDGLGVRYIVVGDDLRFGHDREGDYALIKAEGERYGFETMHTATVSKPDLVFRRVRIRIDSGRVHAEMQHIGRIATVEQDIAIGVSHRV